MKENVLDVLMYLFETYVDTEEEPEADQNELRDELARAGFADPEIDRALDWLDALTEHQENLRTTHKLRTAREFTATSNTNDSTPHAAATSPTSNRLASCRHRSVRFLLTACWRWNQRISTLNRSNGWSLWCCSVNLDKSLRTREWKTSFSKKAPA